ncbi:MAG: serine protease [Gemmatimonadota bacterium]
MWRTACAELDTSVHPVLLKTRLESGAEVWRVIGTAFCINQKYNPTFVTNAHVVIDPSGNQIAHEDMALMALAPGGAAAGFSVMIVSKELDIAVCEASEEAAVARPVRFAEATPVAIGSAVASLGFPIPDLPELTPDGGSLYISERLATGFVSNNGTLVKMPNWEWTNSLLHYEFNMLSYPGISGGPVFDIDAGVVGVNRGSRLHGDQVAAYAVGVRNAELLPFLTQHRIEFVAA